MSRRWAPPTRTTWWALGLAAATAVGTAAYLASIYSSLPFGVPVRYIRGVPAIYQVKSPMLVMLPSIVQISLLVLFGAVITLLLWRARPAAAGPDAVEADSLRMRLAAEGVALLAAVWIVVQALGAARLIALWRSGFGGFGTLYSFGMITAIVISVVIGARTMKLVSAQIRAAAPPDDSSVWRLRRLYFNPRDPALFAPARTGVGWTLNFGRPLAILLLTAALLLGIGGPYIFVRYVLRGFSLE